jgi:hypothetical protein
MAALDPDWAIVDFMVDVSLLLVAVGELKAAVTTMELPEALVTLRDLYEFLKVAASISLSTASASTRPADAALALLNAFKATGKTIADQGYMEVHDDNALNYLNADGIAAVLGAQTVSVMAMSGDGKQLAMWNSGADQSWIATSSHKIIRSKYGTIWEQDPDTWTAIWPDIYQEFPWGSGNDELEVGRAYIINIQGTEKVFATGDRLDWLRVKPYNARDQGQYWICTNSTADTIGFLNAGTRWYLGRDVYQNLACYATSQGAWERLTMQSLDGGGYRLYAHLDDGTYPTTLKSDDDGEYMKVVASSDTVVGLQVI